MPAKIRAAPPTTSKCSPTRSATSSSTSRTVAAGPLRQIPSSMIPEADFEIGSVIVAGGWGLGADAPTESRIIHPGGGYSDRSGMAPTQHPLGYRESIPDAQSMNESSDQGAPPQIGALRKRRGPHPIAVFWIAVPVLTELGECHPAPSSVILRIHESRHLRGAPDAGGSARRHDASHPIWDWVSFGYPE